MMGLERPQKNPSCIAYFRLRGVCTVGMLVGGGRGEGVGRMCVGWWGGGGEDGRNHEAFWVTKSVR